MQFVTSRDRTKIAYDRDGSGPVLILVAGALCARLTWSGRDLSRLLAPGFTVYNYDRRGRGDSGDAKPYAIEREIDDIEALIDAAGGTACLYGHSSGASLVLEAAVKIPNKIRKLALYEAPYNDDPKARTAFGQYTKELTVLLAAHRHDDAVASFMKYVGAPAEQIEGIRISPTWQTFIALAPTLAYDHVEILHKDGAIPTKLAESVTVPALVMYGEASYPFMGVTARQLCRLMPNAKLRVLEAQRHDVSSEVVAPILAEFFTQ